MTSKLILHVIILLADLSCMRLQLLWLCKCPLGDTAGSANWSIALASWLLDEGRFGNGSYIWDEGWLLSCMRGVKGSTVPIRPSLHVTRHRHPRREETWVSQDISKSMTCCLFRNSQSCCRTSKTAKIVPECKYGVIDRKSDHTTRKSRRNQGGTSKRRYFWDVTCPTRFRRVFHPFEGSEVTRHEELVVSVPVV